MLNSEDLAADKAHRGIDNGFALNLRLLVTRQNQNRASVIHFPNGEAEAI